MSKANVDRWLMVAISACGLGLLAGCSPQAPEERLIEVGQDVSDMQNRLESLNEQIAGHEEAIQKL